MHNRLRIRLWTSAVAVTLAVLIIASTVSPPSTQADGPQASCLQDACAADCVAYQFVLGHGNLQVFSRWYDTAHTLTGCDDPDWWTNFQFLLAIAAELVGAPGGYTMDCREMTLGQYSVCSNQCESNPCRYAPNVRTTLDTCGQDSLSVTYDNARGETLPEYTPSAYARTFTGQIWLTGPSGTPLLLSQDEVPPLSYPNWITWGDAVSDCYTQFSDSRCQMLEMFDQPSEYTVDMDWGDGLYDLWSLMGNNSGLDSSPGSDHIRLNSDGDSLTITQGLVSGYVYERWRTKSGMGSWGGWHEAVSTWNAYGGDHTITNHESNSWYNWSKTDRDTYVFATEGPADDLLTGDYSISAEAAVANDKDLADNTDSCSFSVSAQPPATPVPTATPLILSTPTPTMRDIGAGTLHDGLETHPGHDYYRLQVPAGLTALRVTLSGMAQTADFDLEMTRGGMGSSGTLVCSSTRGGNADESCVLHTPAADTYYIHVYSYLGQGPYSLTIVFDQSTPTPSPTATATPLPYMGQTETEPNGTLSTADAWDAGQEMQGAIGANGDVDYYTWAAPSPGIYTVTLHDVPAAIAPDLTIYHGGSTVAGKYGADLGGGVSLTVDANAGDTFTVRVKASASSQTSSQPYTLSLSSVPDPDEPDDSRSTATEWDWQLGPAQGFFWERVSGDADYWTFELPADGSAALLTVQLDDVADSVAPDLTLYHDSSTVAGEYGAGLGESVALTIDANPGDTFVARVRSSASGQVSLQPYTLGITTIDDPYEPNDSASSATEWDFYGGPIEGYFWERVSGPADYYHVTLPPEKGSGLLTFNLQAVAPNVAPDLTIYTDPGVSVIGEYGAGLGEEVSLTIDANAGESFCARVRSSASGQTSLLPYTLAMDSVGDLDEPNDSRSSATVWDWTAGPKQGYFWERVSGDADYFELTAPSGTGTVEMTISLTDVASNVAADLTVYTSSGSVLASRTDAATGESVALTVEVSAGAALYVRVRPSSASQASAQPYTLTANSGAMALATTIAVTATPTSVAPTPTSMPVDTPSPSPTATAMPSPTSTPSTTATTAPTPRPKK